MSPPTYSLALLSCRTESGRKPPGCAPLLRTTIFRVYRAASLCPKEGNYFQFLSFAISDDSASVAAEFLRRVLLLLCWLASAVVN
jgi:hypothetical protein